MELNHSRPFTMVHDNLVPLPKPPAKLLGFSRSSLYALITPSKGNGYKPPVHSVSVKTHPHNKRGKRLIDLESLKAFLASQTSGWTQSEDAAV